MQTRMSPKAPFSFVTRAVYFCDRALPPVKQHRGWKTSCKANPANLRVAEGSHRQGEAQLRCVPVTRAVPACRAATCGRNRKGGSKTRTYRARTDSAAQVWAGRRQPAAARWDGRGSSSAPAAGVLLRRRKERPRRRGGERQRGGGELRGPGRAAAGEQSPAAGPPPAPLVPPLPRSLTPSTNGTAVSFPCLGTCVRADSGPLRGAELPPLPALFYLSSSSSAPRRAPVPRPARSPRRRFGPGGAGGAGREWPGTSRRGSGVRAGSAAACVRRGEAAWGRGVLEEGLWGRGRYKKGCGQGRGVMERGGAGPRGWR